MTSETTPRQVPATPTSPPADEALDSFRREVAPGERGAAGGSGAVSVNRSGWNGKQQCQTRSTGDASSTRGWNDTDRAFSSRAQNDGSRGATVFGVRNG